MWYIDIMEYFFWKSETNYNPYNKSWETWHRAAPHELEIINNIPPVFSATMKTILLPKSLGISLNDLCYNLLLGPCTSLLHWIVTQIKNFIALVQRGTENDDMYDNTYFISSSVYTTLKMMATPLENFTKDAIMRKRLPVDEESYPGVDSWHPQNWNLSAKILYRKGARRPCIFILFPAAWLVAEVDLPHRHHL